MSSNDEEVRKSLVSAVNRGNLELVKELVNRHGLSYPPDFDQGYGLLLNASLHGYKTIVKFLLEKGVALCQEVRHGNTPLHFAVWFGNLELIQLLLDHKAPIDAKDAQYETPLHFACQKGHTNVVELLLNKGADPNAIRELPSKVTEKFNHVGFDQAAFASACQKGHEKFGELVNSGAQVDALAERRPLPVLSESDLIDILDNRVYRNNEYEGNVTPLHIAVQRGFLEIVKLLLNSGAHVDAQTSEGSTPFLLAAANGHIDIANLLLEHCACVNAKDNRTSPLCLAVLKEYTKMVKCLLDWGAVDVNPNFSLLHHAVGRGLKEIVASFLDSGRDANAKDQSGNSLLSYALTENKKVGKHAETIQLLLDRGANLKEAPGLLGKAIVQWNVNACRTLIRNGVDVNAPVDNSSLTACSNFIPVHHIASVYQYAKDQYLQHNRTKSDIPLLDASETLTPLLLACHRGNSKIVALFLNSRANIEVCQKNGLTLLHVAARRGCVDMMQTLLKFGAEIDAQGASNETALHYAVMVNRNTNITFLLENGCDVNIESIDGATAFELAVLKDRSSTRQAPEILANIDSFHNRQRQLVIKAFEHHIVKLRAAGMYVAAKLVELVNFDLEFQQKCEDEVGKMKSEALLNEHTLHCVFSRQSYPQHLRNASLVRLLDAFDYAKYPLYGNLLSSTFKKSKERMKLLDLGKEWLRILLKTHNILNVEMLPIPSILQLEEIVSYLSIRDLSNLISCGENLKKHLCQ